MRETKVPGTHRLRVLLCRIGHQRGSLEQDESHVSGAWRGGSKLCFLLTRMVAASVADIPNGDFSDQRPEQS